MNRLILLLFISLLLIQSPISTAYNGSEVNSTADMNSSSVEYEVGTYQMGPQQDGSDLVVKMLAFNILQTGVFDEWRDVIKEENADILMLSETGLWDSTENEDFLSDLADINSYMTENGYEPYTYYNLTKETTSTGGGTIISRFEITDFYQVAEYFLDDGTVQRFHHDLPHAVITLNDTDVHVVGGIHLTCCEDGAVDRVPDMEAAINYIDALGDVPVVFAGDFNTLSPYDTGDLAAQPSNLDTETLSMLLFGNDSRSSVNHTWIDTYRELNPYTPGYSYVDKFYKSRIDYIFVNQHFEDTLVNATVGDVPSSGLGSDHFAVDATINFNSSQDLRPPFRVYPLEVTVTEATNVTLTWPVNPSTDTQSYTVYRDGVKLTTTSSTSFIDDAVPEDMVIKYEVSATDDAGNEGRKSYPKYYNSSYGVLSVPSKPVVEGQGLKNQIKLTWSVEEDGGSPVQAYYIFRATATSIEDNFFRIWAETTDTEFVDDLERTSRPYYYKVVAVNMIGESLESDVIEVLPLQDTSETDSVSSENTDTPAWIAAPVVALIALPLLSRRNRN